MHGIREYHYEELFPQSECSDPESLIVLPDKQSVDDALDIILNMQSDKQAEIRQNQRRRQHASIITLEEARAA